MGEIAALLTAFCWAFTAILFSKAGREVGSLKVNRLRLLFALVMLVVAHLILLGTPLPLSASPDRWMWLGLSGVVGLVLGDACLFQAYVLIGPRISTLIMAVVPVISTLLAWVFLNEKLSTLELAGILVAVVGVSVVVLERGGRDTTHIDRRRYALGVLFGFGGALGQALGLILAKRGLYDNFPSVSGVVIRMVVAASVMWLLAVFARQAGPTLAVLRKAPTTRTILLGALVGPFLGVWLSLAAVQASYVGIASTLMALTPIIVLPIAHFVSKEQISLRAVVGTFISIAGVVIIFLVG